MKDKYRFSRGCYIVEAALEYFITLMMSGAYLARITRTIGLSDSLTGIISAFVSLGCLVQLGAVTLIRGRSRLKKPIIILQTINQLLFTCVYLIPGSSLSLRTKTILFLVCYLLGHVLAQSVACPKLNWLISMVDDHKRGSFHGLLEIVSLLGSMAFTMFTGTVIDHMEAAGNINGAFLFGAVTVFILTVLHAVTLILTRESDRTETGDGENSPSFRTLLSDRSFLRVVLVGILWQVTVNCSTVFYGSYQIKELGFSMSYISILGIIHSLLRAAVTPFAGRYGDKHGFSRMLALFLTGAFAAFAVNIFTVPANGRIMFIVYNCLYALAMAGVGNAIKNLVLDCYSDARRRPALALNSSISGVSGFLAACAMSPIVSLIQKNGCCMFGMTVYPAQFVSAVSAVLTLVLIFYIRRVLIRKA